jgi:hypothetical protein
MLIIFRIIWALLFASCLFCLAWFQLELTLEEKLLILGSAIAIFVSLWICFLRTPVDTSPMPMTPA